MLLPVVLGAETDDPAVGGLHSDAAVCANANVGTFNRKCAAVGHRASVRSNPATVAGADARIYREPLPAKPLRKFHGWHWIAFSLLTEVSAVVSLLHEGQVAARASGE